MSYLAVSFSDLAQSFFSQRLFPFWFLCFFLQKYKSIVVTFWTSYVQVLIYYAAVLLLFLNSLAFLFCSHFFCKVLGFFSILGELEHRRRGHRFSSYFFLLFFKVSPNHIPWQKKRTFKTSEHKHTHTPAFTRTHTERTHSQQGASEVSWSVHR